MSKKLLIRNSLEKSRRVIRQTPSIVAILAFAISGSGVFMQTASAAPATVKQGSVTQVVAIPDAGTCTLKFNYTLNTNVTVQTFEVDNTKDTCTGGGTIYFQAKLRCTFPSGVQSYAYGGWKNVQGQSSTAGFFDSSGGCEGHNGVLDLGGFKYNMNNPSAYTCFVPGDSRTGTCGTTT